MLRRILLLLGLIALVACGSSSSAPQTTGLEKGDALPDLALVGYLDRNHDGALTPDENGPLTPEDVLAANPKAELLLVHVAFGWCTYCWQETKEQLKMTQGYGGRFVSTQVLIQDRDGQPATKDLVDSWIHINASAMPTALEPAGTLFKRFGPSATYLLVDVKAGTTIIEVGAGPPTFGLVRQKIADRLGPLP